MTDKTSDWHEKLRAPFPEKTIGTLPKPYKKDSPKAQCRECGGYHGLPAAHLSYVGHAAITDRLLSVDPEWSWEPLAVDQMGLPALDREGNLWIRLTVHGHSRLGVGDGPSMKVRIGDALRNAAMRFGVALDLWSKEEFESAGEFPEQTPAYVSDPTPSDADLARQELRAVLEQNRIAPAWAGEQFQARTGTDLNTTTDATAIRELTGTIQKKIEEKTHAAA